MPLGKGILCKTLSSFNVRPSIFFKPVLWNPVKTSTNACPWFKNYKHSDGDYWIFSFGYLKTSPISLIFIEVCVLWKKKLKLWILLVYSSTPGIMTNLSKTDFLNHYFVGKHHDNREVDSTRKWDKEISKFVIFLGIFLRIVISLLWACKNYINRFLKTVFKLLQIRKTDSNSPKFHLSSNQHKRSYIRNWKFFTRFDISPS